MYRKTIGNKKINEYKQQKNKYEYNQKQKSIRHTKQYQSKQIITNKYYTTYRQMMLKTIRSNIQLDYDQQYSQDNLKNILSFYSHVYQQPNQSKRNFRYTQLKSNIKQPQQLDILHYLSTKRAIKYSGNNLPTDIHNNNITEKSYFNNNNQSQLKNNNLQNTKQPINQQELKYQRLKQFTSSQIQFIPIHHNHSALYPIYSLNKQHGQSKQKQDPYNTPITIGKSQFRIQQVLVPQINQYKWYLTQFKMNKNQKLNTCWILQKSHSKQYFWRGDIAIDQPDVQKLLLFLLTKIKSLSLLHYIVINAGYHGNKSDQRKDHIFFDPLTNAYGQKDQRLIKQTQQVILKLNQKFISDNKKLKEQNKKLQEQNQKLGIEKVFIINKNATVRNFWNRPTTIFFATDIDIEEKTHAIANHVIVTRCFGAYARAKNSIIKVKQSMNLKQMDLPFLSQACLPPKLFKQSDILYQQKDQINILSFFNPKQKIKQVRLLFSSKQSSSHSVQYFIQNFGSIKNVLFIVQTLNKRIIGGFSPLSHGETSNKDKYVKDLTKTSFIYSLSYNEKFQIKKQNKAIRRHGSQSRHMICFGEEDLLLCEMEQNWSYSGVACRSKINNVYYNKNYVNSEDKQSCKRFNGFEGVEFGMQIWQAWQIKFN